MYFKFGQIAVHGMCNEVRRIHDVFIHVLKQLNLSYSKRIKCITTFLKFLIKKKQKQKQKLEAKSP